MSANAGSVAASLSTDPARIRELLLANLFAVFGERDRERRLQVIARNYTDDVIWTDPDGTTQGHEAMNEQAQKLLQRMPTSCSAPQARSTSAVIWASSPSTWACRSSRPRSAASTWHWCVMDGSPACTPS